MKKPWHESDEFWETTAPMMFGEERLAATPEEIDHIISLLDLQPGVAILDMGCGIGRHTLELARRGYRVTGLDRTEAYLNKARQVAQEENLAVEFILDDMRQFTRPDTYDAALSLYTSFSYFEDPSENRQVLVNIFRSLKEGGSFILEMMGKEVLARIFIERDWQEQDGMLLLQERRVSRDWSWMENRWIMLRDGERSEFQISHWLYSASELADMLKDSGFSSVEIFGDLESAPYDHTARRLVAVAHKYRLLKK